jgi:hypothetical protein
MHTILPGRLTCILSYACYFKNMLDVIMNCACMEHCCCVSAQNLKRPCSEVGSSLSI